MKCVLAVRHGSLSKELIRAFERHGFIKVGQGIFLIVGYRQGGAVYCEFDLEDAPAGVRPSEVAVTVPFGTPQAEIRSSEWDGEGLPPVGLTIEVLWSSDTGKYYRAVVIGHDNDGAVVRFLEGQRAGEYEAQRPCSYNSGTLPGFRPIRTAEQLAAEKRIGAIEEMIERCGLSSCTAEFMYDAGYRKVDPS